VLTALAALFGWASHHAELYPPSDVTNADGALAQAAGSQSPSSLVSTYPAGAVSGSRTSWS